MRGFQLWINLPASQKMKPASYKDIPAEDMQWLPLNEKAKLKLIAGTMTFNDETFHGAIEDKSMGIHNPKFVKKILENTIASLQ